MKEEREALLPASSFILPPSERGLDWRLFIRLAERHGVLPLLYRQLSKTRAGVVPEEVLRQISDDFHKNAARNLYLAGELVRLLEGFRTRGILAVPYKGPTLALLAHGNLALRQFCDLDLLLRKEDISQAGDSLVAQGFRPGIALTPCQQTMYLRSIGQLPFLRDRDGLLVELHAALMPEAFPFRLDFERIRSRLQPVILAGREVQTLDSEDLLLLLCAHGSKHLWRCLGWICDIALLIRHQRLDWPRILSEAQRLACERLLFLGLDLAKELLHAPVPAEIQQIISSCKKVKWLAEQARQYLFTDPDRPIDGFPNLRFQFQVRERWSDSVWTCQSLALSPTVADWTSLPLPPAFSLLYRFIRPLRLVSKYARRLVRGHNG